MPCAPLELPHFNVTSGEIVVSTVCVKRLLFHYAARLLHGDKKKRIVCSADVEQTKITAATVAKGSR